MPEEEVEYLPGYLGRYMQRSFTQDEVRVGYRLLVTPQRTVSTAQITYDHHIDVAAKGLLTVPGGTWTTYRQMVFATLGRTLESADLSARFGLGVAVAALVRMRGSRGRYGGQGARTA